MLVNIEMRGNDQIAFAPREIKRVVPVREFGIQSMACLKKEKDALNPAECNNNSLTVISCLSVSRREYEYRTIGESSVIYCWS